jgi:hypothetical protein
MSPPLRGLRGGEPAKVTVGYGAGGGDSIEFTLSPGEVSDTGFLKLFVSTSYVDMDWISQGSPFDVFSRRRGQRKAQGGGVWDAWVAGVTVYTEVPADV